MSFPYTSPPQYQLDTCWPGLQWQLFCGWPALCWIKEIDCGDVDFWEGPAFRKGDVIRRPDFPWGHSMPFVHQKLGLGGGDPALSVGWEAS